MVAGEEAEEGVRRRVVEVGGVAEEDEEQLRGRQEAGVGEVEGGEVRVKEEVGGEEDSRAGGSLIFLEAWSMS